MEGPLRIRPCGCFFLIKMDRLDGLYYLQPQVLLLALGELTLKAIWSLDESDNEAMDGWHSCALFYQIISPIMKLTDHDLREQCIKK